MNQELFTKFKITSLAASGLLVLWYFFDINISEIQLFKDNGLINQQIIAYVLVFIIIFCSIEGALEISRLDEKTWQTKVQTLSLVILPIFSIVLAYPKIIIGSVLIETSRLDLILPIASSIIVAFLATILNFGIVANLVFYKLRKTLLPGQIFGTVFIVLIIALFIFSNSLFINGQNCYSVILRNLMFILSFIIFFIILSPKEELFSQEKLEWLSKKSDSLDRRVETYEYSKSIRKPISMPNKKIHKQIMKHIQKGDDEKRKSIFPRFIMLKELSFKEEGSNFVPSNGDIKDEDLVLRVNFIQKIDGELIHTEDVKFKYIKQACKEVSRISVGNDIRSFLTPMATKAYYFQRFNESDPGELMYQLSMDDENLIELKCLFKKRNPDINYTNADGWTALLIAAANGQENTAKFLLQKAADPSRSTKHGASPLHFSAKYGKLSLCKLLIAYQADIDQKDIDGSTPLMLAARYGHGAVVRFLIENGANTKLKNYDNKTAIDFAAEGNYGEICRNIKKHSMNKME